MGDSVTQAFQQVAKAQSAAESFENERERISFNIELVTVHRATVRFTEGNLVFCFVGYVLLMSEA